MTLVTAGLLRPRALLPTRGLGRFPSAATQPDTHDGFLPEEILDAYRKAKRREYSSKDEIVSDMRSMLQEAVAAPETAKEATAIERTLISRKGVDVGGRTYIQPVIDYSLIAKDSAKMLQLLQLWQKLRKNEDDAILMLLMDD